MTPSHDTVAVTVSVTVSVSMAFPDATFTLSAAVSQPLQRAPLSMCGPGSTALLGCRVAH
eukprot:363696-Chlamydomonas_euryale.AAC.7